MKKIILLALFAIVGILGAYQLVYAATSTLSASPAAASKNVGAAFNVSVQLNPAGNEVCVVSGTLSFNKLTCKSITVATGLMAQNYPTCDSPSFTLGIPGCTTAIQNIFSVSVAGTQAGQASLSIAGVENLGSTGADVPSGAQGGVYNITKVPTPTPTPTPTPVACVPNWQIGEWSTCVDSQQTRTVTDLNNCGIITDEPDTLQPCVEQPVSGNNIPAGAGAAGFALVASAYFWPLLIILIILAIGYGIYYFLKRNKK